MQYLEYNRLAKVRRQDPSLNPLKTKDSLLAEACRVHDLLMAGMKVSVIEAALMQAVDQALSAGRL